MSRVSLRVLAALLLVSISSHADAQALSPRNANYTMTATLNAPAHTMAGSEVITWRNITTRPAIDLQFHLCWNAWKHDRTTFMRERVLGRSAPADTIPAADRSRIDVTSLKLTA